jgi:predicted dehydrogenase
MTPNVAVIGCGAVSELYYAPALIELERAGEVQVSAFYDPNNARAMKLKNMFPQAQIIEDLGAIRCDKFQLAIVASPVQFHAEQSVLALKQGVPVLCEKPLAANLLQAQEIVCTAEEQKCLLAVGLYRRYLPAAAAIKEIVDTEVLGKLISFKYQEGVRFNWPAQSDSFFKKTQAGGGVLLDMGVHVFDLLSWWFGETAVGEYQDDAMGGIESNCLVYLNAGSARGSVRLSRDWNMNSACTIDFANGQVTWNPADARVLSLRMNGSSFSFKSSVEENSALPSQLPHNHQQAFLLHLRSVVAAVSGKPANYVSGRQALDSLRLIEECYKKSALMEMPWLPPRERERAIELHGTQVSGRA